MADSPEAPVGGSVPAEALLRPGERLGWVFRDRNLFRRPFGQPPPSPGEVPPELLAGAKASDPHLLRKLAIAIPASLLVAIIIDCALLASTWFDSGLRGLSLSLLLLLVLVVVVGGPVALIIWQAQQARAVASRPAEVAAAQKARYDHELADWNARKAQFDAAEQQRSELLPEWTPAATPPSARRIDLVGGSLWGWEGLLTVFGSSTLASGGQLTVLDLTGEAVCRELAELATDAGIGTDVQYFPEDLPTADLLAGLDQRQFVDVLVEAVHGGDSETTGDRFARSMDDRALGAVCAVLAQPLTIGRLLAAIRLLLGEPEPVASALLSDDERRVISNELFSADYRREIGPRLRQLESLLHPLAGLGSAAQPSPPAQLVCVATGSAGSSARDEVLGDLIVQRLSRGVAEGGTGRRTVVVVGADPIARRHLERLSDLCERRDVRLVYLFRHLRDTSLQVLGAGAVGFMRLGNHQEAAQAAEFIGREQRFVLTRLTHQLGGAETHTAASTEGETKTTQRIPGSASLRRPWRALPGIGGSTARAWSSTASQAQATNWNDAETYQRAAEYSVEPRILQGLPDYAMLLVTPGQQGPVVTAVECNPAIVTLPRVSTEALPPGVASSGYPLPSGVATPGVLPPAGVPPVYAPPPQSAPPWSGPPTNC
jgi:hypothetical protein